mmetsp:Transcript_27787/g.60247  ORF Transcript_27787/g.60247 Transcript_27787/m.60247 type:complete len:262 (+) Transcript_27787:276-1061(+)
MSHTSAVPPQRSPSRKLRMPLLAVALLVPIKLYSTSEESFEPQDTKAGISKTLETFIILSFSLEFESHPFVNPLRLVVPNRTGDEGLLRRRLAALVDLRSYQHRSQSHSAGFWFCVHPFNHEGSFVVHIFGKRLAKELQPAPLLGKNFWGPPDHLFSRGLQLGASGENARFISQVASTTRNRPFVFPNHHKTREVKRTPSVVLNPVGQNSKTILFGNIEEDVPQTSRGMGTFCQDTRLGKERCVRLFGNVDGGFRSQHGCG